MEQELERRWRRAVAETLRAERAIANLSVAATARRAGITRSSYDMYEKGIRQPTVVQMAAIAEVFGVPLSKLISEASRRADGLR